MKLPKNILENGNGIQNSYVDFKTNQNYTKGNGERKGTQTSSSVIVCLVSTHHLFLNAVPGII